MATKKQMFNQLGSSQPVSVEYESVPIGEGAQGSVHRIVRVNNTLCATWVIKLLFQSSPQLIQRLKALVEFLHSNQLNTDSLCCVPFTLLQTKSGELAIPMYYANAPDIDNGGGLPSGATLPRQLRNGDLITYPFGSL